MVNMKFPIPCFVFNGECGAEDEAFLFRNDVIVMCKNSEEGYVSCSSTSSRWGALRNPQ